MEHLACMIDIETLSLQKDAIILSVAAVITDLEWPSRNYNTPTFERLVDLHQDRHFDPDTLMFHMQQPLETIQETFRPDDRMSLRDVLVDLRSFIHLRSLDSIWSKGADFDIVILENAYHQQKIKVPWTYKQPRCFRTMLEYAKEKWAYQELTAAKKHTALADALVQAKMLHEIWNNEIPC